MGTVDLFFGGVCWKTNKDRKNKARETFVFEYVLQNLTHFVK